MRILLITQWFDPEPTFKGLLFARELQRQGHEVEVLTGFPNYPGGKMYPGYRIKPFERTVIEGVPVLRVALYPSHDQSGARRALNYLSFAATSALGALTMKRPDVVYVYHPPATAALPAVILRLLKGVPFVYDIQDLWPDTLAATGMLERAALLRPVERGMQQIYRHATQITVLSDGFRKRLIERGVPEAKIRTIPNWTDEAQIDLTPAPETLATELGLEGTFKVVFAGTMGKAQALDTVLDAARLLQEQLPEARFVLVGGGIEVDRLKAQAEELNLPNIHFLPRRPPSQIGELLQLADALLVHLKDDPLFSITVPSKTQAYLMAGKPILMGVRGDAARMVEEAQAGLAFEPQSPSSLAAAVIHMAALDETARRRMGQAGRQYYQDQLSLAQGTAAFVDVFERAVRLQRPGDRLKRTLDVTVATSAVTLLSPVLLLLALLIRQRLGSPVLFKQERPGRNGQPFTMYKFRSMTDARAADGTLLPDGDRLTAFGRFLRASSLDELPELYNVLRGDMSLVGPRPLLTAYLPLYSAEQSRRHDVRPGLTGWAQVNGRNALSWEQKFEYDVWYVENRSVTLDLKILLMTIQKVLKRDGISAQGEATMPLFTGKRA